MGSGVFPACSRVRDRIHADGGTDAGAVAKAFEHSVRTIDSCFSCSRVEGLVWEENPERRHWYEVTLDRSPSSRLIVAIRLMSHLGDVNSFRSAARPSDLNGRPFLVL